MPEKPYSVLASIYNHLMKSIDYKSWSEYIIDLIESFELRDPEILELASGIGGISKYLEKKFDRIIYSDKSLWMLKNFELSGKPLVCCDMTSLPFRNEFDVVFSIFDSVNYLADEKKLRRMFNEVGKILKDDGYFTFDASLEKNSLRYQKQMNRKGKYKGIRYKQKSSYNLNEHIHYNIFEIELENGEKVQEIHKERIFPLELFYDMAKLEGMYVSACYDTFTFNKADKNSERAQFIVRKRDF